ncbi:MAG: ABC transporter substrate-binding protein [Oligoflexia bacterium]|nr:ABC transporter substrate-binding protein [Oligoflexia bacterium]
MRVSNSLLITVTSLAIAGSSLLLWSWRERLVSGGSTARDSANIRIGAVLCLTGICAEWGNESLRGALLAVEELNRTGGVLGRKIELVPQDSQEEQPTEAINAFHHLRRNEGISLFLGPTWTPAGLALAPLAERDTEFLMISPSLGVKNFNEASPNLFNTWPHDEGIARRLAHYAYEHELKRVAIMSATQQWSQTQAAAFSEELVGLGGQVVAMEEPVPTQNLLNAEATRLIRAQPQAILFTCLGDQEGNAAKQLRGLGFDGPVLSVLVDETTLTAASGTLEGVVFGRYPESQNWFKSRFQDAFGKKPGISSDTAYDAIHLYARAAELANSLAPDKIREQLQAIHNYAGASGTISFDPTGGVPRTPTLLQVRSGAIQGIEN